MIGLWKKAMFLAFAALPFSCGSSSSDDAIVEKVDAPVPFASVAPSGTAAIGTAGLNEHVVIASDVSGIQRDLLQLDFSIIESWDGQANELALEQLRSTLQLDEASNESLVSWLKARVKYLLNSDLSAYSLGQVYPGQAEIGLQPADLLGPDEANTGASNMGTALYLKTLERQAEGTGLAYIIVQVDDVWVSVLNPRVGLVRMGPALFAPPIAPNPGNPGAISNSLQRIEVLFHEARHSDGNQAEQSLGFPHVDCPDSPQVPLELIGMPACDSSRNGAYSVGLSVLDTFTQLCDFRCSAREKAVLRGIQLDRLSRLGTVQAESVLNPNPESGFQLVNISEFEAFLLR